MREDQAIIGFEARMMDHLKCHKPRPRVSRHQAKADFPIATPSETAFVNSRTVFEVSCLPEEPQDRQRELFYER